MIELIGIFITSFFIAFSGAIMPGPLLTVTISESAERGAWAGPLLMVGHSILELAFILLILQGLGDILMQNSVLSVIAFFGSFVLLWMGFGMIVGARTLTLDKKVDEKEKGKSKKIFKHPIVAGILVSLSNPYWTVWWLTIGLAYIFISAKFGVPGIACFFIGHILADFVWYTAVSTSISLGKRFFTDNVYRGVVGFCGLFLLGFSFYFFYSGFDYLMKI